jgi:hypothetical protein
MSASITLFVRLGPMVSLRVSGQSCQELAKALEGYDDLNVRIDSMCGDLANRIYPEGLDLDNLGNDQDQADEEELRGEL